MSDWTKTADLLPTDGVVVETKIDDDNGVRNVLSLKRVGRLWYAGDMYVYYTPTHWREPLPLMMRRRWMSDAEMREIYG